MTRIVSIPTASGIRYAIEYSFLGMFKRYKCTSLSDCWWTRASIRHALYKDLKDCVIAHNELKNKLAPVPLSELEKVIYDP